MAGIKWLAGLSLTKEQLNPAMNRLCELAKKEEFMNSEAQDVLVDGSFLLVDVNIGLIDELENCGPFGSAIREPKFAFLRC